MEEENEERRRYCREHFGELPVYLRQAIGQYLRDKTLTRRGDADFEIWVDNVSLEFGVRNRTTRQPLAPIPQADGHADQTDEHDRVPFLFRYREQRMLRPEGPPLPGDD
jgi:hypothetical protein